MENTQKTDQPCRICNKSDHHLVYNVREMMFGTGEVFQYLECSACGCLQLKDVPEDMSVHYPENYHSFSPYNPSKAGKFSIVSFLLKERDRYNLTKRSIIGRCLNYIIPSNNVYASINHLKISKNARILDVGCGSGELLYKLHQHGYTNSVGIDPYIPRDVIYENGLTLLKKSIDQLEGQFDLIMFNHSFEHMDNHAGVLKEVDRLLKSTGICMIRIPTASSYAWKHYKENWVQIDAPRHLYLHSIKSLEVLCKQISMYIDEVIYDSDSFQFWGSEQHKRGIPLRSETSCYTNPKRSVFSNKEILHYAKLAQKLNQKKDGDMAAFFIKKISKMSVSSQRGIK